VIRIPIEDWQLEYLERRNKDTRARKEAQIDNALEKELKKEEHKFDRGM